MTPRGAVEHFPTEPIRPSAEALRSVECAITDLGLRLGRLLFFLLVAVHGSIRSVFPAPGRNRIGDVSSVSSDTVDLLR